jgi:hypothetical protein
MGFLAKVCDDSPEKGIATCQGAISHLKETAVKQFLPVRWTKSRNLNSLGVCDMFPYQVEETISVKEFALMPFEPHRKERPARKVLTGDTPDG